MKEWAKEKTLRLAYDISHTQNDLIENTRRLLHVLSLVPAIEKKDLQECGFLFASLIRQYPVYANFGLVTPEGKVVCSGVPFREKVDFSDREWFSRALRTQKFTVGNYRVGRISEKVVLACAHPVFARDGSIEFVLFSGLNVSWFEHPFSETALPLGSMVCVIDKKGTLLAHYPDSEKWTGQKAGAIPIVRTVLSHGAKGFKEDEGVDGTKSLYAFYPFPDSRETKAYVIVGIPSSAVYNQANRGFYWNLLILAITGLLALSAGWWAGERFILRPIDRLIDLTKKLSQGEAIVHSAQNYSTKEFGRLAHAFGQMAISLKDVEDNLRRNERKFRELIENSSDLITVISPKGDITYQSPSQEIFLGFTPEEITGRNISDFMHPEDLPAGSEKISQAAADIGNVYSIRFRLRHKDGSWRLMEGLGRAVLDDQGDVRVIVNSRDVTRQKQTEKALYKSEETYRNIVENAQEGIWTIDAEGITLFVNPKMAEMLGYTPEEMVGSHFFDFVDEKEKAIAEAKMARCRQGIKEQHDFKLKGKNGLEHWTSIQTAPLYDQEGNYKGALGMIADISQRKKAEEQVCRRAEEFESLYLATEELAHHMELVSLLNIVLEKATMLLGVDNGAIIIYDRLTDKLQIRFTRGDSYVKGDEISLGEGMSGRVAKEKNPMIVDDYSAWEHALPQYRDRIKGAIIQVPMLYAGELMGILSVNECEGGNRIFDDADLRILSLFASHAASAIHNARLFEEAANRLNQVQALRKIDMAITASLDLRVTFQVFLDQVIQLLEVDAADILLLESHSRKLNYAASRGFRTDALRYTSLSLGEGYAGQVALDRRYLNIPNLQETADAIKRSHHLYKENFVHYMGIPLVAKGKVLGVLEVFNRTPLVVDREWEDFLEALAGQAAIAIDNTTLFNDLQKSNIELLHAYDTTIEGWSHALDLRDKETKGHSQRVTELTVKIAKAMDVPDSDLSHIRRGALLHDIGKMGIPDSILLKPGALSEEEWKIMKKHPEYAYELLYPIAFLRPAIEIPYCHHEKWDGSGYPRGLKGEHIPFAARIFALVDVWDALCSVRSYRAAWPMEKTIKHIKEQAGKHFDPSVVEIFLENRLFDVINRVT